MMLHSIEGVYRDGRIELVEQAPPKASGRVIVTFLDSSEESESKRDIMELHGKGSNLWGGVEASTYVAELRSEWDR